MQPPPANLELNVEQEEVGLNLVFQWDEHLTTLNRFIRERKTVLLTESTVEEMFRKIVNEPERCEETFERAEDLIDEELRPESPLRHRLSQELEELRKLAAKA